MSPAMDDRDCVAFLQWALPRLGMRWHGFRKVRHRVCKRIDRRLRELGLRDPDAYRTWLQAHPHEWSTLDSLCTVTISRFARDRMVFAVLQERVLPELASRVPKGAVTSESCRPCAQQFADALEEFVREHPWQFFNFYDLWDVEAEAAAEEKTP